MRPATRWLVVLGAGVAGALAAYAFLSPRRGPGRPDEVEAILRAIDADDRGALRRALDAAGDASRFARPWSDEVALGRAVVSGDLDAVLAFATSGPDGAARARALLYVRTKASDADRRERASRLLAERYPDSWAVRGGAAR